ncbi:FeoA family protein [Corynebacterium sp.]|uniref:FeoA family protein n=1 Tax=Corynebacterium sp. TaxID=1720 RepID=UPI0026DC75B5|nr:FeoA family protein [Corynebacterium sp.]MDO5075709.1 FeoA family protein [Corynebacterium sp.]
MGAMDFKLDAVPLGQEVVLAPIDHPMRRRLAELGIREGARLRITQRTSGGGRVIDLDHTRYAIDGRTASELIVRPVQEA